MAAETLATPQDLTVRGESIERVYGIYQAQKYLVNRRYQRKLIWTLEEKISFIDSILNGYPVPIILLAENRAAESSELEIIDGMQRLNAITSFIENEYAVRDTYFDLNTMAATKQLLDSGAIRQKEPVMDRADCIRVAAYQLPFSIYEFLNKSNVDEVFRRINSGGRKLSRQELRAAGATGHFANVVRLISAKVRGDASHSDTLALNEMKKISITNRELAYGIPVDDIFWVKHGILEKDQVRQSRDEEQIADIVAYMVSDSAVSSRVEFIDDYYGVVTDESSEERFNNIESSIQRRNASLVISDFQRVLDELLLTLEKSGGTFGSLMFTARPSRAPRYFQAVFLAFYELIVRQNKEVKDYQLLIRQMRNSGDNIDIQEGGRWGAEQRERSISTAIGLYQSAFGDAQTTDPAVTHWINQLQNILSQSYTEQSAYDYKQGFLRLDETMAFDEGSFEKILKTCVGIANIRKGYKGYVLVGVAENATVANRVEEIRGGQAKAYSGFYVVGVDSEASALGKNIDQFFQLIIDKIRASKISEPLKDYLLRHLKPVRYYDKTVFVFEILAQEDPSHYDGTYFIRHGAQLSPVATADLPALIRRYDRGS